MTIMKPNEITSAVEVLKNKDFQQMIDELNKIKASIPYTSPFNVPVQDNKNKLWDLNAILINIETCVKKLEYVQFLSKEL